MEIINLEGVTYLFADIFSWGPVDVDPEVTKTLQSVLQYLQRHV